jgi:ketosteroid isomerase-like protein
MAFREAMKAAMNAKDAVKLKAMYTETFTHTHGSGKVDGRDARIVSLLTGDPVIEDAPMSEVSVRVHGDAAILAARSPILNKAENKLYDFRWTQVYVKEGGAWKLAVSQATRLGPTAA